MRWIGWAGEPRSFFSDRNSLPIECFAVQNSNEIRFEDFVDFVDERVRTWRGVEAIIWVAVLCIAFCREEGAYRIWRGD